MSAEPVPRTGDWRLVAPTYAVPDGQDQRESAPSLQKFGSSQFMEGYLADPAVSLPFDECDWVFRTQPTTAPLAPGGRRKRLSDWRLVRTSTRKLFLPTHKRFYVVACELHCESAGFPNACPDDVCEVGFVVRRRRVVFEKSAAADATRHVKRVVRSAAELDALVRRNEVVDELDGSPMRSGPINRGGTAATLELHQQVVSAVVEARDAQLDLRAWAADAGAVALVEGWLPAEEKGVGSWRSVKERPGRTTESVFPMFRLVAPPDTPAHAATGRALWYGVVPTATGDHDELGQARFDDRSLYEIRCFVRRHRRECPRKLERNDCCGVLTWSRPTTVFQLAAQQDLVGTSNLPVTIQLPDIPALMAQAAAMPREQIAPVKFVTPPGSSLKFAPTGGIPTNGSLGGAQICSFSIPLITIVATFLLNLFLPIVVLLFGLFLLLRLKFCIPPSFQLSADLTNTLRVTPPGVDLDVSLSVNAGNQLRGQLESFLNSTLGGDAGTRAVAQFGNDGLLRLVEELATTPPPPPGPRPGGAPGVRPSPCAALVDEGTS